jgi:hypothetical protein
MISEENFVKAVTFANDNGLKNFFLHGGEPTLHPDIVRYAHIAKEAELTVKMFTNGKKFNTLRCLDGIVDEIKISYRGPESLVFYQEDWTTKLALEVLVTEESFPTLQSLLDFLAFARKTTGMTVYANTMNPINQDSYNHQFVSYLEQMFLELPLEKIFCTSNKATFLLPDGTRARLGNKSLNPGHEKYSMNPNGTIQNHFDHSVTNTIIHNAELDAKLEAAKEKLLILRNMK